jgi:hypothetical protein
MKNNKTITWILVIALVGIWGAIMYQIYESISSGDGDNGENNTPAAIRTTGSSGGQFIYTNDVRDPFRSSPRIERTAPKSVKPKEPIWIPPPLKLSGIIVAKKKRTAILEGVNGSTFFLAEGDTLQGVKILKITPTSVNYLFMKKKNEWVLENR